MRSGTSRTAPPAANTSSLAPTARLGIIAQRFFYRSRSGESACKRRGGPSPTLNDVFETVRELPRHGLTHNLSLSTSARPSSKCCATPAWPARAARCKAVRPPGPATSKPPPQPQRPATTSAWPNSAATHNGVLPSRLLASHSARASHKRRAMPARPAHAAVHKDAASTPAPCWRTASRSSACPARTACKMRGGPQRSSRPARWWGGGRAGGFARPGAGTGRHGGPKRPPQGPTFDEDRRFRRHFLRLWRSLANRASPGLRC